MVVRRRYNWSKSYRCYNYKNSPMASRALSSSHLLPQPPPTPAFIHHEDMSVSRVNDASQIFPSFPLHLHLQNSFYTSNLIKESLLLGSFLVFYIWLLATCPHSEPIFWPHPALCLDRWCPDNALHRLLEQLPYIWVLLMGDISRRWERGSKKRLEYVFPAPRCCFSTSSLISSNSSKTAPELAAPPPLFQLSWAHMSTSWPFSLGCEVFPWLLDSGCP